MHTTKPNPLNPILLMHTRIGVYRPDSRTKMDPENWWFGMLRKGLDLAYSLFRA